MILALVLGVGPFEEAPSLLNRPAPPFSVKDMAGHAVSPRTLKGAPAVLFVFCSCRECKVVAEDWARIQHDGLLDRAAYRDGQAAVTLVSYFGKPAEVREFARRTKLSGRTVFLDDPKMSIARDYRAMPCPSVFVLDRNGFVRYSSKEQAGELVASSSILLGQALVALRSKSRSTKVSAGVPAPVVASGSMLTAAPGDDVETPATGEVIWRPKGVNLNREQDLSREFVFTNRSKVAVSVSQVLASCGCQKAELVVDGRTVSKAVLGPGRSVTLRMVVHLLGNGEAKHVSAWLYSATLVPLGSVRVVVGG